MASLVKREGTYYLQWYVGSKMHRRSLRTKNLQIAKEKLRQFESAKLRGDDTPLPTRTKIEEVIAAYVLHIRSVKTPKSAQADIYYLREVFGTGCPALQITSRVVNEGCKKRPPLVKEGRRRVATIEASFFEAITTADISQFISIHVRTRGLAPKTANRYREILVRLFNWSMQQFGVKMPGDKNPAARVERYKERAPEIRFLTLSQIDEQLDALSDDGQLQTMVAMLIYAGLRRAELLWLTREDITISPEGSGMIRIRAKTINQQSWQPKTRVNRAVPISASLLGYLTNYCPRPCVGDWFFPSPRGTRWEEDNFSSRLREANKEHGLVWGCLDYRHTFGSQLAQRGVSLYKIATLLGNSPDICRRHYAALLPEAMVGDVEFHGGGHAMRRNG